MAPKAIQLIVNAYQMLGMPEQAAHYQAIYNRTFGQS
jgi:hypothetical protein